MHPLPRRRRIAPLAAALAVATAASLPASSAPSQTPETQVWIDVATHNFASMPDMGAMGGLAGMMGAGAQEKMAYPTALNPASSGQYLDIAMHNSPRPGVEAQQAIPGGLKLGKALPLLPPLAEVKDYEPGIPTQGKQQMPDGEMTIHEYWGCGDTVRPGQPKTFKMKFRGGKLETSGSVTQTRLAPARDISVTPAFVVWPNRKHDKRVPNGAVLAGQHRISGTDVPASLQFDLGGNAEFMPKIALRTSGQATDAMALGWQPVDRARAYFLNAVGAQGQNTMVFWSSAESPGAGHELQQYLSGSYVDRWLKEKVLLPPSATSCTIPKGIFASAGGDPAQGGMGGMAMLSMIAYGPETHMVWPPKPTDPEELKKWDPEWNLRVRTKSTASAMLGMDFGGAFDGMQPEPQSDEAADGQPQEKPESTSKKLLKGILRNL
ncbi:hypothetical protein [Pseudoxanthomonas koreensis]|uniref:hypothetical protein n=1 Tax=Pseudoxanthomonas koreensis TaxID=266061 RepID=UPI0013919120|nr:hypothetical protein [Pseudoxanthomonas koreensis]KAF1693687.1 hypothetical protein CSC64_04990 [Pseudoxanthomonas koreensis]